jgi:hypothetical protein
MARRRNTKKQRRGRRRSTRRQRGGSVFINQKADYDDFMKQIHEEQDEEVRIAKWISLFNFLKTADALLENREMRQQIAEIVDEVSAIDNEELLDVSAEVFELIMQRGFLTNGPVA